MPSWIIAFTGRKANGQEKDPRLPGTQWHPQRHISEELGTVQINWDRDFIHWRERRPNWRVI